MTNIVKNKGAALAREALLYKNVIPSFSVKGNTKNNYNTPIKQKK